ncbi:hypothetical protein [Caballeronia cordobensis]|uniref:hypothetical protein n=1 Tax=Caballeronia cordobensis TaxID=1353886 RepID=UPI00190F001E|nr:hypothetical protein [Caballeronia cordobensis]
MAEIGADIEGAAWGLKCLGCENTRILILAGWRGGALATLQNEMIRQGVRKSELARRLNVHMPQVDRLLDPRHSSKIEAIEAAFRSLGKRLNISVA